MTIESVKKYTLVLVVMIVLLAIYWFTRTQEVADQVDTEAVRLDSAVENGIQGCNECVMSSEFEVYTHEDNSFDNNLTSQVDRNKSTEALNSMHPEICVELWRDEHIGIEEALRCIEIHIEHTK